MGCRNIVPITVVAVSEREDVGDEVVAQLQKESSRNEGWLCRYGMYVRTAMMYMYLLT